MHRAARAPAHAQAAAKRTERPLEIDLAELFKLDTSRAGPGVLPQSTCCRGAHRGGAAQAGRRRRQAGLSRSRDYCERLNWIAPHPGCRRRCSGFRRGTKRGRQPLLLQAARTARSGSCGSRGSIPPSSRRASSSLLGEIERGAKAEAMRELEIPHAMREAALTNLRSKTFDAKQYSARVLRRISVALGQDPGPVNATSVTIEHILPRGYAQKSGWRQHFPSKKVGSGPLPQARQSDVPDGSRESGADTLDWGDKRPDLRALEARAGKSPRPPLSTGRRNRSRTGPRT